MKLKSPHRAAAPSSPATDPSNDRQRKNDMKKYNLTLLLVGLTASIIPTPVRAAEKLEQGKDRVDTPAVASGLCVHNLFQ
jgi:hypothetical protein